MKRWKLSLLLLAGIAMLSACGSGGTSTNSSNTASSDPSVFYPHTAVFLNNTTLYVWGGNESGQLGNGGTTYSSIPVRVARFANYSAGNGVSTGSNHTLAFQKYSTIRSWGFNRYGQLGDGVTADGQTPNRLLPVTVRKRGSKSSLSGVVAVAAGGYYSLALDRNSDVWSWGNNFYGQLGRYPRIVNSVFQALSSQTADRVQTDVNGSPFTGIISIAAGGSHSLALDVDGNVWAWGYNGFGQVGDGSTTKSNRLYPVKVIDVNGTALRIVKIAAGGSHSLALDSDGHVWSWGYNYFGQLGNGLSGDNVYSATPAKISIPAPGLDSSALIAAGVDHSLAYDPVNDILYVWGFNLYGQLGTGNTLNSNVPVAIINFKQRFMTGTLPQYLSATGHSSYIGRFDGPWLSWGDNSTGQLGNGSTVNSSTPQRVKGF